MAEEKKKKTFRERLDDPVFKGLGGFNFFEMPTSPGEMYRRIEEAKKKDEEEKALEEKIKTASDNIVLQSEKEKQNIIDEAEGNNEVSLSESVSTAIISGGIKIPYGWAQLTAEIKDAVGDDVPLNETNVAKLDAWFDQTVVGELMKYSE